MSQTLTISDELYAHLEAEARTKSADSIERLLEQTHMGTRHLSSEELRRRQEAVSQTIALQERLSKTLGMMPDSAEGADRLRQRRCDQVVCG